MQSYDFPNDPPSSLRPGKKNFSPPSSPLKAHSELPSLPAEPGDFFPLLLPSAIISSPPFRPAKYDDKALPSAPPRVCHIERKREPAMPPEHPFLAVHFLYAFPPSPVTNGAEKETPPFSYLWGRHRTGKGGGGGREYDKGIRKVGVVIMERQEEEGFCRAAADPQSSPSPPG